MKRLKKTFMTQLQNNDKNCMQMKTKKRIGGFIINEQKFCKQKKAVRNGGFFYTFGKKIFQ